jgi:hypothetical protein
VQAATFDWKKKAAAAAFVGTTPARKERHGTSCAVSVQPLCGSFLGRDGALNVDITEFQTNSQWPTQEVIKGAFLTFHEYGKIDGIHLPPAYFRLFNGPSCKHLQYVACARTLVGEEAVDMDIAELHRMLSSARSIASTSLQRTCASPVHHRATAWICGACEAGL